MAKFKATNNDDGTYNIKGVPIFAVHTNRGFECNYSWMTEAICNFNSNKKQDYLPPIIIGHNVKGLEKEAVGFLDNLALHGKKLYADLVKVPKWLKEKILTNAYPSRSVEILPKSKRILALALLGGTTPHFALPQMSYKFTNENSHWIRSPLMFENMTEEDRSELYGIIQHAAHNEPIDETEVYELGQDEIIEMFNTNQIPEIYENEETGECFSVDEDGVYYAWPAWALKAMQKGKAGAGAVGRGVTTGARAIDRGAKATGSGIAKGARAVGRRAKAAPGKVWAGTKAAGRGAQQAARHPIATAKAGGRGMAAGAKATGRAARKNWKPLAIGASIGANVGATAQRREDRTYSLDGYTIDDDGIMYDGDGDPIGQSVPTADTRNAIPSMPEGKTPALKIAPKSNSNKDGSLTKSPGAITGDELQTVNREDSPMFNELDLTEYTDEEIQYMVEEGMIEVSPEQQEIYELRQEVENIRYENDLAKVGKGAEQLQQYLLEQKKLGSPVGNIDDTLAYLLTQDENQLQQYKTMLESSPKVQLGTQYALPTVNVDEAAEEAKIEYAQHSEDYQQLGVTAADLQFADLVRVDAFTKQRS